MYESSPPVYEASQSTEACGVYTSPRPEAEDTEGGTVARPMELSYGISQWPVFHIGNCGPSTNVVPTAHLRRHRDAPCSRRVFRPWLCHFHQEGNGHSREMRMDECSRRGRHSAAAITSRKTAIAKTPVVSQKARGIGRRNGAKKAIVAWNAGPGAKDPANAVVWSTGGQGLSAWNNPYLAFIRPVRATPPRPFVSRIHPATPL
ncbi:hypothetical protein BOTBODRAFT_190276 [Botryobasidium botryosum FD-172 SS1]|uniref:Uncharacterized protein n=1 Tax=Botryobasidium botryosum (strain FD-172 SS1) TaxID=930990 RepID=A0A067M5M1_BOTB1|nr:hypothetical protein BOTBODRAFT_190276 [Botryobasidium botryosum FD-172 SS1]